MNLSDNFKEFLLKEYSGISKAHFNTLKTISEFFKHYLVIMALPAAVYAYFFKKDISNFGNLMTGFVFLGVSLIGFGVCLYVINLRFDAILYARSVNGIRKLFYDDSGLKEEIKLKIRILPQSTLTPSYHEVSTFWPVIIVFALFNSAYMGFSIVFFLNLLACNVQQIDSFAIVKELNGIPLSAFVIFLGIHFLFYKEYANYREYGYLKSNIIGVDVDGVLNKHRDHFCTLLYNLCNISIWSADITHIPVNELDIGITKEHEYEVFNNPTYWTEMPVLSGITENIKKLKNGLNFKIIVFTYRPWPDLTSLPVDKRKPLKDKWEEETLKYINSNCMLSYWSRIWQTMLYYLYYKHCPTKLINQITSIWLKSNNILYDKLIIEKGNENIPSNKSKFINRFRISGNKKIRFFIEDDLEKAVKLSYLCDVVFLIKHPYNQDREDVYIPSNVIMVDTWNQIYRMIRILI